MAADLTHIGLHVGLHDAMRCGGPDQVMYSFLGLRPGPAAARAALVGWSSIRGRCASERPVSWLLHRPMPLARPP
jgi:hypothetical protein